MNSYRPGGLYGFSLLYFHIAWLQGIQVSIKGRFQLAIEHFAPPFSTIILEYVQYVA